jgi:putative nucleotidyltransferase with HDIG domain
LARPGRVQQELEQLDLHQGSKEMRGRPDKLLPHSFTRNDWSTKPATAFLPTMTRDEAQALLKQYTQSDSLLRHAYAVEAAMRRYAERFGEDAEKWGLTGLLHDFDYESWPNPPEHTRAGAQLLREQGMDEEIVGAILSHAEWNQDQYPLDRPIRKALFAVDELCGFVTAVAYVRPEKLQGMAASSVRKKMKQRSFAAAVKREDIEKGAQLLGLPLDEQIAQVIAAMQGVRAEPCPTRFTQRVLGKSLPQARDPHADCFKVALGSSPKPGQILDADLLSAIVSL